VSNLLLLVYNSYRVSLPEPSGVASYGAVGHVRPSSLGNSVHSVASASLTVKF